MESTNQCRSSCEVKNTQICFWNTTTASQIQFVFDLEQCFKFWSRPPFSLSKVTIGVCRSRQSFRDISRTLQIWQLGFHDSHNKTPLSVLLDPSFPSDPNQRNQFLCLPRPFWPIFDPKYRKMPETQPGWIFFASQVILVSHWLTDVTLVSDDTFRRLYWWDWNGGWKWIKMKENRWWWMKMDKSGLNRWKWMKVDENS